MTVKDRATDRARGCQTPCRPRTGVGSHRDDQRRGPDTAQRHGHLWVALADDVPVGFAHIEVIEPTVAHLEEIDVHPHHGRRGLGTKLVRAICAWAIAAGYHSVTLTTFRDVPWNMPFYARLGFEVIPSEALSPALRSVVQDETRRGLDPTRRVAMRRPCAVY